jgi:dihydrodipicolinate synthase/N-acetylneuraminate lyase
MLVMPSGDEYLLACFVLGARGSQVSIAGTIPETVVALDRGISAGDLAAARAVREMIWPLAKAINGVPPANRAMARVKTSHAMSSPFAAVDADELLCS